MRLKWMLNKEAVLGWNWNWDGVLMDTGKLNHNEKDDDGMGQM